MTAPRIDYLDGREPYEGREDEPFRDLVARAGADGRLAGADLSTLQLGGVKLAGADLSGADLSRSLLSFADLSGTDLTGARLDGAKLHAADLSRAKFERTSVLGADLTRAKLRDGVGAKSDFSGSVLTGADLTGFRAERSAFRNAVMDDVDLRDARFHEADLRVRKVSAAISGGRSRDQGAAFVRCSYLDVPDKSGAAGMAAAVMRFGAASPGMPAPMRADLFSGILVRAAAVAMSAAVGWIAAGVPGAAVAALGTGLVAVRHDLRTIARNAFGRLHGTGRAAAEDAFGQELKDLAAMRTADRRVLGAFDRAAAARRAASAVTRDEDGTVTIVCDPDTLAMALVESGIAPGHVRKAPRTILIRTVGGNFPDETAPQRIELHAGGAEAVWLDKSNRPFKRVVYGDSGGPVRIHDAGAPTGRRPNDKKDGLFAERFNFRQAFIDAIVATRLRFPRRTHRAHLRTDGAFEIRHRTTGKVGNPGGRPLLEPVADALPASGLGQRGS